MAASEKYFRQRRGKLAASENWFRYIWARGSPQFSLSPEGAKTLEPPPGCQNFQPPPPAKT
jgi:hypothetical protein